MEDYIVISQLNDFIFCPYSIYLHNVYMMANEDVYHAAPQTKGRVAHESVDKKTATRDKEVLLALPVYSEQYGLMGKIDMYNIRERKLIERKYQLRNIYQGQIYQLWAQMFCLREMGYAVEHLAFYEISTNKMLPQPIPTDEDEKRFADFLHRYRAFNPESEININPNKCRHCIYCNLCDKTELENVY